MSLDLSGGMGDLDANSVVVDKDLQNFIIQEQQIAQFNAQVHKLTEQCWEKCVTDKLTSRFDGKTETCLTNCVERFIDASVVIAQRFSSIIQKQAGH